MSNEAVDGVADDRFAEPWPAWRGPEPDRKDAVAPRPSSSPAAVPDEATAAFKLENLHAAIAQGSAIVPLLGPLIAFLSNSRGSFARREAAKAFNGQVLALLFLAGPLAVIALPFASWYAYQFLVDLLFFVIPGWWLLHAILGLIMALTGRDWQSWANRAFHLTVLPEGEPDPVRSRKRRKGKRR